MSSTSESVSTLPEPDSQPAGAGVAAEQTAPPGDDERVQALRQRVASGGSLNQEEREFLRSEGIDLDPDHDPMSEKRGGSVGRGFWDEDRDRDLM